MMVMIANNNTHHNYLRVKLKRRNELNFNRSNYNAGKASMQTSAVVPEYKGRKRTVTSTLARG